MSVLIGAVCLLLIGFSFGYLLGVDRGRGEEKAMQAMRQAFPERPMLRRKP